MSLLITCVFVLKTAEEKNGKVLNGMLLCFFVSFRSSDSNWYQFKNSLIIHKGKNKRN